MPHEAFGPEWTRAWVEAIRESDEYRAAAARWEGSVLLIARGDPAAGMPEDRRVYLDLHRGECRDGRVAGPEDEALADLVLSADLPTWKAVLGGSPDPLAGLARGRLMLEKGGLAETGYDAYYQALEGLDLFPGLREGIGYLKRDEFRHIAYGVFLLSRLVAEEPGLWDVAEGRMNELFPLAMELILEIFQAYDPVPFDLRLEEFMEIATTNFSRRMQRIGRAREQTLDEVYGLEV